MNDEGEGNGNGNGGSVDLQCVREPEGGHAFFAAVARRRPLAASISRR